MDETLKITRLIETKGTTRVYELADGSTETRDGGTVSWRNNNPGNLKLEYADSADKTVTSTRSYEAALEAAQSRYEGVVALDQWGNAIFETPEAGRAAQATLVQQHHGNKTIADMVTQYARDDYSGQADHSAYANSIYAEGDRQGVELRDKKIQDLNEQEVDALLDGMKRVEGFREGSVTRTPARAESPSTSLTPQEQRVHQMAIDTLSLKLSTSLSSAQIDSLARSAAVVATGNAHKGDVQNVFLSKDQQTLALKQSFGISELGVNDVLRGRGGDTSPSAYSPSKTSPALQPEAPVTAAYSR